MSSKLRLQTLLHEDSHWLKSENNGITLSSRIRLARNVSDQAFRRSLGRDEQELLTQSLLHACRKVLNETEHLHLLMDEATDTQRKALVERFLVSPELAASRRSEAVIIANDEQCSAMINEEDHMRLQILQPGLNPGTCRAV